MGSLSSALESIVQNAEKLVWFLGSFFMYYNEGGEGGEHTNNNRLEEAEFLEVKNILNDWIVSLKPDNLQGIYKWINRIKSSWRVILTFPFVFRLGE